MLVRPLNFTQNDLCATSDKNANFNIWKNLLCKVGISNSLGNRAVKFTISKRQIKARGTHTPTHDQSSPSWENCRAVPSQQLPPVFFPTGFPRLEVRNYTSLGLHSRHCGDFCCDFRGVCVSFWTPAPVCSWFPVLPLS